MGNILPIFAADDPLPAPEPEVGELATRRAELLQRFNIPSAARPERSLPLPPRWTLDSRAVASDVVRAVDVPEQHWRAMVQEMSWKDWTFKCSVAASEGGFVEVRLQPWGDSLGVWPTIAVLHVTIQWQGLWTRGERERYMIRARALLMGLETPGVARAQLEPWGHLKWKLKDGRYIMVNELCVVVVQM